MSFNMACDGLECPHFGAYRKQMPGDLLCMSKEKATRMGNSDEDPRDRHLKVSKCCCAVETLEKKEKP